ncbi:MAG: hypothetical protein HQL75_02905 [Magnetococcales bacterium]|nr:hypothetical protein [Magnetococcales bacterium]
MELHADILPWTFLILGGAMSLYGLYRIITMGLAMILWSAMLIVGLFGIEYGLSPPPTTLSQFGISSDIMQKTGGFLKPGRDLSEAAMADLCHRMTPDSTPVIQPTQP